MRWQRGAPWWPLERRSLASELRGPGPEATDASPKQLDALARGERSRIVDPERAVLMIATAWAVSCAAELLRKVDLLREDADELAKHQYGLKRLKPR